jgi:outer membrane protein insertion porin family
LNFNKAFVPVAVALALLIEGALARAGAPVRVTPLPLPEAPPIHLVSPTVPGPAPNLAAFEGKPVRGAEVVLESDPWGDIPAPTLRSVRPGEPFRAALARAALLETLRTQLVGDAKVDVVPEGDGVRIRVRAVPRRIIDGLRVEVHRALIDREEILHEAQLEEGGELLGDEIAPRKRRILALLARRGFPNAQVDLSTRQTDTPTRVLLVLDVSPGAPRKVGRRVFYAFGAKAEDLERYTKQYEVDRGDRVDETALQQADIGLANRLRAAGYHEAAVKHDVVLAQYPSESVVTLRVRVDSGPRYYTRFDGNEHYDADTLQSALGLDTDPDTGEQHLAEKLRRYYVARGFLDAEVGYEIRGRRISPTRFIVFHVREGRRVRVASRQYPCVRDEDIAHLTGGGPSSAKAIGRELDSFLDEDLPGADFVSDPDPRVIDRDLGGGSGARAVPIDLDPNTTFSPETYDKGVAHVQELYRNEGFLNALVGPVQVLRRRCDPRSPPGRCVPVPFTQPVPDVCTYDRSGLPLAVGPLDPSFTCVPDRAHGVECEPRVSLRIPIKLGPRTTLTDIAFSGAKSLSETELSEAADLQLGKPVSALAVEEARHRVVDRYREEGFYYADVSDTIERSLDNTHARVRFDVNEGERVIVKQIVIQGNAITNESVIRRRVALEVGKPFRTSDVRKTQERIATLNVFTSVSVVLQDAQVPQHEKTVIITVAEKPTQYIEPSLGFSTGEGARGSLEYGYTNLFGSAISAVIRGRVSYLPDFLISDQTILQNFQKLSVGDRIAYRATLSLGLPDILLGPTARGNVDAVYLQDVERYFVIKKAAGIPTVYFRPSRENAFALSASFEYNNLNVFNNQTPAEAATLSGGNLDIQRLLLAPAGESAVFSQRLLWSWDRRDNSFNAHSGTFLSASVEHVDWSPIGVLSSEAQCTTCYVMPPPNNPPILPQAQAPFPGHFLKLAGTFSGYFPLPFYKKIIVAATLRIGGIIQLADNSTTYPDRFFFMGGIDSLRSYQQDSMLPQDAVDQIDAGTIQASQVAIRGGNLLVNPRVELRIPISGPFETVLFFDTGNLWQDAAYPFDHGIALRAAVGSGVRVQTPVGPIALDYGINLTRHEAYEDFGALNFAIGLF